MRKIQFLELSYYIQLLKIQNEYIWSSFHSQRHRARDSEGSRTDHQHSANAVPPKKLTNTRMDIETQRTKWKLLVSSFPPNAVTVLLTAGCILVVVSLWVSLTWLTARLVKRSSSHWHEVTLSCRMFPLANTANSISSLLILLCKLSRFITDYFKGIDAKLNLNPLLLVIKTYQFFAEVLCSVI